MSSFLLLCPGGDAEYCDERMPVCLSVCLSIRTHLINHKSELSPNFLRMFPVAVARSSIGGVIIRRVVPVLRMTLRFPVIGRGGVTLAQQRCYNVMHAARQV